MNFTVFCIGKAKKMNNTTYSSMFIVVLFFGPKKYNKQGSFALLSIFCISLHQSVRSNFTTIKTD